MDAVSAHIRTAWRDATPTQQKIAMAAGVLGLLWVASPIVKRAVRDLPVFKYKHVDGVATTVKGFEGRYVAEPAGADARRTVAPSNTSTFYDLVTDFYEYGWGQSFHFAPRHHGESFAASILRYEHLMGALLALPFPPPAAPAGQLRVLDIGCGVGGPMRAIAHYFRSKVRVTGVNISAEHIRRARRYNAAAGLPESVCDFIHSDFNAIGVPDDTFDAAYDFEATLHSPDTTRTFREIYRVVKPGARVVTAQYCVLPPAYDAANPYHVDIIRRVDNTNGAFVSGRTPAITEAALRAAGFEVEAVVDVFAPAEGNTMKFTEVFESQAGARFAGTPVGRAVTMGIVTVSEMLGLAPKGTRGVQKMLIAAAEAFKEGGRLGIISPGVVFILRKPAAGAAAAAKSGGK